MLEKIVGLVSSKNDNEKKRKSEEKLEKLSPESFHSKKHSEISMRRFFPNILSLPSNHLIGMKMPPIHD